VVTAVTPPPCSPLNPSPSVTLPCGRVEVTTRAPRGAEGCVSGGSGGAVEGGAVASEGLGAPPGRTLHRSEGKPHGEPNFRRRLSDPSDGNEELE